MLLTHDTVLKTTSTDRVRMSLYYRWQGEDLLLLCHLQPKAKTDEIVGPHGDRLKIRITAPPIAGKANRHLIEFFAKTFKVPKSSVKIISGELSRDKQVLIQAPKVIPQHLPIPTPTHPTAKP